MEILTNTIASIRYRVNTARDAIKAWFEKKAEDAFADIMSWALSKPVIQHKIASRLRIYTSPLYRTLDEVVERHVTEALNNAETKALSETQVSGMIDEAVSEAGWQNEDDVEKSIESKLDDLEITTDQIQDLDKIIQEVVNDDSFQSELVDSVAEEVVEKIINRLRR